MSELATIELRHRGHGWYEIDDSLQVGDLCGELPPQHCWTVGDLEATALSLRWVLQVDETTHGRRYLHFRRSSDAELTDGQTDGRTDAETVE